MYLVGLGLVFMALKYLEIGIVATWSWLWILSPFAVAVAWWTWADASGYTKRKAMEAEDRKKKERIERNREAMGFLSAKNKNKKR